MCLLHLLSFVYLFILIIPPSEMGSAARELEACQGNFSPSSPRASVFMFILFFFYIRDTSKNNCLEPIIHLLCTSKNACMTLPLLSFPES